jgi:hypothetical protein
MAGEDWPPIGKEDLALTEYAGHKDLPAVVLYRSVVRDDPRDTEKNFVRIKVLSPEGRKFGDVELPRGINKVMWVEDVKARMIKPDGTVVPFQGQIFEKVVASYKGSKLLGKSFVIPDVQVGSIIDYTYTVRWAHWYWYPARFEIESALYAREIHLDFIPSPWYPFAWASYLKQIDATPIRGKYGVLSLNLLDVKPLEQEEYTPPRSEVQSWFQLYYLAASYKTPDDFWRQQGKWWVEGANKWLSHNKAVNAEAARITSGAANNDEKLRRLYKRATDLRNLSYENSKTSKEEERQKLKTNESVDDVLQNGYGWDAELVRLFVGLARAAGFDASVVRVAERDNGFFHREVLDFRQLNKELARVKEGDKVRYFDPGTPYCKFGMVYWDDMYTTGMQETASGGTAEFFQMPPPLVAEAQVLRNAELKLDASGAAEGELHIKYVGQEALRERLSGREDDEAERKKHYEEKVKGWLPPDSTVKLLSTSDWKSSSEDLEITLSVSIPNFAAATGTRLLIPTTIFPGLYKHPFPHMERSVPIYFGYPFKTRDVIDVELPEGAKVESLATPRSAQQDFGTYGQLTEAKDRDLEMRRSLVMNAIELQADNYYADLKKFYDTVSTGDREQVVVRLGK